jgi:hypothetical protein
MMAELILNIIEENFLEVNKSQEEWIFKARKASWDSFKEDLLSNLNK